MKQLIAVVILMFPALASAQDYQSYQNMNEADIQKMMTQMNKAQACMADADQAELKKFEVRANQMEAKVKALCASGKRNEAEQEAMAFGREVAETPTMQKMQKCGKLMEGAMPDIPGAAMPTVDSYKDRHICDN